jgi:predicted nucleotide-binding protein
MSDNLGDGIMSEDKEPVPLEGELVSADVVRDTEFNAIIEKMLEVANQAVGGTVTQNVRDVEIASLIADALYTHWKGLAFASPETELILNILKHGVALFTPLTRAVVFQAEGRFSDARDEIAKGLGTSDAAIAVVEEYAKIPNAEEEVIQTYGPVFHIFRIIFNGMDAYIRAEFAGYQGEIRKYRELLLSAIHELRQAANLPPSLNPMFPTLVNMCTTMADRSAARLREFASWQEPRCLRPYGDKILIIHGHAEAKWRELQSLLKKEFSLDAVVLKEEPITGETLIEKFENFAHDSCCYAFALVTRDDFIEKEGRSYFQARPNVLFEVGWFYGHFGRDRICILRGAGTEMPSDLAGIRSIDFHEDVSEAVVRIRDALQRVEIVSRKTRRLPRRSPRRAKEQRAL